MAEKPIRQRCRLRPLWGQFCPMLAIVLAPTYPVASYLTRDAGQGWQQLRGRAGLQSDIVSAPTHPVAL